MCFKLFKKPLGSPTPMVSWLKEESVEDVLWIKPDTKGYKIASSGRQHSLILMDVGTEYTGAYTCIATNRAGQSICTAHLEVDESKENNGTWAPYINITLTWVFSSTHMFPSLSPSTTTKERDQTLRVRFSLRSRMAFDTKQAGTVHTVKIEYIFNLWFSPGFLGSQLVLQRRRLTGEKVRHIVAILSMLTVNCNIHGVLSFLFVSSEGKIPYLGEVGSEEFLMKLTSQITEMVSAKISQGMYALFKPHLPPIYGAFCFISFCRSVLFSYNLPTNLLIRKSIVFVIINSFLSHKQTSPGFGWRSAQITSKQLLH